MEPVCGNTNVLCVPQQSCEGISLCHCLAQSSTPLASVAVPDLLLKFSGIKHIRYQLPCQLWFMSYK